MPMTTAIGALSKTGYDERAPLLVSWGARALYVGSTFNLSAHRNAVAVLAFGISADLQIAPDGAAQAEACRSCLIEPNTLHHLTTKGIVAFVYLDADSAELARVRARCGERRESIAFDIARETDIIAALDALYRSDMAWHDAARVVTSNLELATVTDIDARIIEAIAALRTDMSEATTAEAIAAQVGLSVSRFLHLFSAATGVPFRRYRLWCRLTAAVRAARSGANLTDAAHAAGFASSSHFSSAFHDMFGMSPSALGIMNLRYIEA
jgi:AraC-like DNA-binding protein